MMPLSLMHECSLSWPAGWYRQVSHRRCFHQHLSEKPEVHFHDFAIFSSFLFFLHFAHTFG